VSTPPTGVAPALSFGYSEVEDRLVLTIHRKGVSAALLLTRRLSWLLINGLARILERSSAIVSQVPAEFRDDMILLEHQKAIQFKPQSVPPSQGATDDPKAHAARPRPVGGDAPPNLVLSVGITIRPKNFGLVFKGKSGPLVQIEVSRPELHRILEIFKRRATAARWNLTIEASWLEPDQTELVIN
jgi:hypothetical protein